VAVRDHGHQDGGASLSLFIVVVVVVVEESPSS